MTIKRKVFSLLFTGLLFCIAFNFVQTVDATKYNVIDEGFGPVKDYNDTKFYWKVYYSNNQLIISNKYVKGNSTVSTKKISIKKLKNKLIFNSNNFNQGVKSEKNSSIMSNLSLKSYYFKMYQSKMLKNIVTKKIIDSGWGDHSNGMLWELEWKAHMYNGKKVLVSEKTGSLYGEGNGTILIERHGKNQLKITKKDSILIWMDYPKYPTKNSSITFIKTSLSPKEYYFKIYKAKLFKSLSKNQLLEISYGLLKDSKTKFYWNSIIHLNKKFIRDKLTINRGFSYNSLTYDKITIKIFSKNQLIITYQVNKTTELNYINSKLLPLDYYYKVYRPEMIEIFNKSTIEGIPMIY